MAHLAEHRDELLPGLGPEILGQMRGNLPLQPGDALGGAGGTGGDAAVAESVEQQLASGPAIGIVDKRTGMGTGQVEPAGEFAFSQEQTPGYIESLSGHGTALAIGAIVPKAAATATKIAADLRAEQPDLADCAKSRAQENAALDDRLLDQKGTFFTNALEAAANANEEAVNLRAGQPDEAICDKSVVKKNGSLHLNAIGRKRGEM